MGKNHKHQHSGDEDGNVSKKRVLKHVQDADDNSGKQEKNHVEDTDGNAVRKLCQALNSPQDKQADCSTYSLMIHRVFDKTGGGPEKNIWAGDGTAIMRVALWRSDDVPEEDLGEWFVCSICA